MSWPAFLQLNRRRPAFHSHSWHRSTALISWLNIDCVAIEWLIELTYPNDVCCPEQHYSPADQLLLGIVSQQEPGDQVQRDILQAVITPVLKKDAIELLAGKFWHRNYGVKCMVLDFWRESHGAWILAGKLNTPKMVVPGPDPEVGCLSVLQGWPRQLHTQTRQATFKKVSHELARFNFEQYTVN